LLSTAHTRFTRGRDFNDTDHDTIAIQTIRSRDQCPDVRDLCAGSVRKFDSDPAFAGMRG